MSASDRFVRRTFKERKGENEHTNKDIGKNGPAFGLRKVSHAEWLVARKVEANGGLLSAGLRLRGTPTSGRMRTVMKTKSPTSFVRRCVNLVGWIVPSAIVALIPKCPMCLAAYVAAWTGIGLSFSGATHLRLCLLILSAGLILFLAARTTLRLFHKFCQCETIIRRSAVC